MERWVGKVAVVTGASAGIGAKICHDLVVAGMTVVGLDRREERFEALRNTIPSNAPGRLLAIQCDVTCDDDIAKAFDWIANELGAIHVMVNNAGVFRFGTITGEDSNAEELKNTLQTNLWGSIQCTRKAVEIMRREKVTGAHIVLINSVAGHKVPSNIPGINVYPVSKFGLTALAEVLQQEFNDDKRQYKVTSISPGTCRTEIIDATYYENVDALLNVEDVSNAVLYALGTPPHVNIAELTIKPVGELS